jgi:hypothetical protein
VSRLMEMVFTKEELLSSSVSGTNSSNRSLSQISRAPLDENKKKNRFKNCSVSISQPTFSTLSCITAVSRN